MLVDDKKLSVPHMEKEDGEHEEGNEIPQNLEPSQKAWQINAAFDEAFMEETGKGAASVVMAMASVPESLHEVTCAPSTRTPHLTQA